MNPILQTIQQINQVKSIISNIQTKNPDELYNQLMQDNPNFRKFIEDNQGKTPEQIAQENNIDIERIKNYIRR